MSHTAPDTVDNRPLQSAPAEPADPPAPPRFRPDFLHPPEACLFPAVFPVPAKKEPLPDKTERYK